MKYVRFLFTLTLVFTLCSAFSFKGKTEKKVYAFGFAASFKDTVAYYTDIQELDSVSLTALGFLPQRDLYSYQLKNYLEYDLNKPDYTCMIFFSDNKSKLEQEANKVKGKYTKNAIALQAIDPAAFKFVKPEIEE